MIIRITSLLLMMLVLAGCGAKRPVLYPNEHYKAVGPEAARMDIDTCQELARSSGVESSQGREVAETTVQGAAVGTATGAVVGAVSGGNVGRGALIGGAGAATAGFIHGLFSAADPDPLFMQFVDQCLREKGYHSIGWQ